MSWLEAALWGAFGGFAVEGLDFVTAVRRHGRWPWRVQGPLEVGAPGYLVAELIRLVIGGGLAGAMAVSEQSTSAVGALAVGIAAPLIVERLSRAIPLTDSAEETGNRPPQPVVSSGHQQYSADRFAAGNGAAKAVPARDGQQPAGSPRRVYPDGAEQARAPDGRPGGRQE